MQKRREELYKLVAHTSYDAYNSKLPLVYRHRLGHIPDERHDGG